MRSTKRHKSEVGSRSILLFAKSWTSEQEVGIKKKKTLKTKAKNTHQKELLERVCAYPLPHPFYSLAKIQYNGKHYCTNSQTQPTPDPCM